MGRHWTEIVRRFPGFCGQNCCAWDSHGRRCYTAIVYSRTGEKGQCLWSDKARSARAMDPTYYTGMSYMKPRER